MYNYTIIRLSYIPVFCHLFLAGAFIGGFIGLTLGYLDRTGIGWLGGGFIGLLTGIGAGVTGVACILIFNLLAPVIGGIPVRLESNSRENSCIVSSALSRRQKV